MGVQDFRWAPRPWPVVLGMPEGELRMTTATARYQTLMANIEPTDYPDDVAYTAAVLELRKAYDQACRELGFPG